SAEDARFVEIVRRNAARLQRMVEELLFLSRVDVGGLELDVDEVDVVELVRAALGSADPAAAAKRITLEYSGPGTLSTKADADRLGQVFDNLISNAIKFTPERGSVNVSLGAETGAIVASVADNGVGIPQAEQPRLFERFFRTTATRDVPGTGLGLTIVRAIVEAHGGTIECTSSADGTTFTFTLPAAVCAVGPPAVAGTGGARLRLAPRSRTWDRVRWMLNRCRARGSRHLDRSNGDVMSPLRGLAAVTVALALVTVGIGRASAAPP